MHMCSVHIILKIFIIRISSFNGLACKNYRKFRKLGF